MEKELRERLNRIDSRQLEFQAALNRIEQQQRQIQSFPPPSFPPISLPPPESQDALLVLLSNIATDQSQTRAEIKELRQEVGLSMPPHRTAEEMKQRAVTRLWFHLRASVRYGLVAGAGALSVWLADWLAHIAGR